VRDIMHVTDGSIADVLTWFRRSEYEFIFLFVVGDICDKKIITDAFDQRELLDVISHKTAAIVLFSRYITDVTGFKILPGELKAIACEPLLTEDPKLYPRIEHISTVSEHDKCNIVSSTAYHSTEIMDKFGIEVDDLPCQIIVSKYSNDPLVIKTMNQFDIKTLCKLLREIYVLRIFRPEYEPSKPVAPQWSVYALEHKKERDRIDEAKKRDIKKLSSIEALINDYSAKISDNFALLERRLVSEGASSTLCKRILSISHAKKINGILKGSLMRSEFSNEDRVIMLRIFTIQSTQAITNEIAKFGRFMQREMIQREKLLQRLNAYPNETISLDNRIKLDEQYFQQISDSYPSKLETYNENFRKYHEEITAYENRISALIAKYNRIMVVRSRFRELSTLSRWIHCIIKGTGEISKYSREF